MEGLKPGRGRRGEGVAQTATDHRSKHTEKIALVSGNIKICNADGRVSLDCLY